jgi:MarR family transcriptional regulator for hemolysin
LVAKPVKKPIGRVIAFTAKGLDRAFGAALAEAGGSLPTWLILLELKRRETPTQNQLAQAIGIEGPTLTRHLDGLEQAGLVARVRDPEDRRAFRVRLTEKGEELFGHLRQAAVAFDRRLRSGLSEKEVDRCREALAKMAANVGSPDLLEEAAVPSRLEEPGRRR